MKRRANARNVTQSRRECWLGHVSRMQDSRIPKGVKFHLVFLPTVRARAARFLRQFFYVVVDK